MAIKIRSPITFNAFFSKRRNSSDFRPPFNRQWNGFNRKWLVKYELLFRKRENRHAKRSERRWCHLIKEDLFVVIAIASNVKIVILPFSLSPVKVSIALNTFFLFTRRIERRESQRNSGHLSIDAIFELVCLLKGFFLFIYFWLKNFFGRLFFSFFFRFTAQSLVS